MTTNAFYWPNFILVLGSTTCAITQEHYPTISCIFKSQVFTYSQVCVLLLQSLHLHPNLQQKMYSTLLTMRNLLLFSTLLSFLHVWRSTWVNVTLYLSYVKVEYPWYARLALLCTILPTVIQILWQIMHSTRQVLQTVNSDSSPVKSIGCDTFVVNLAQLLQCAVYGETPEHKFLSNDVRWNYLVLLSYEDDIVSKLQCCWYVS